MLACEASISEICMSKTWQGTCLKEMFGFLGSMPSYLLNPRKTNHGRMTKSPTVLVV